jgi:hypothetical protein
MELLLGALMADEMVALSAASEAEIVWYFSWKM